MKTLGTWDAPALAQRDRLRSGTSLDALTPLVALALAACGGGGGGGGGSISAGRTKVDVTNGPVMGARVYADENNSGTQDSRDTYLGRTDSGGQVTIAPQHSDKALVVVVDGAVDTTTGRVLKGTWRSLPADFYPDGETILVSPITDQLARQGGRIQSVLDRIFGRDTVTLGDVIDPGNYDKDSNDVLARLVSRAAVALTEIHANPETTGTPSSSEAIRQLTNLFQNYRTNPDKTRFTDDDLTEGPLKHAVLGATAFTSGSVGAAGLVENSVTTARIVYLADAELAPLSAVSYSLASGILDNNLFNINPSTGAVTFGDAADADHEHAQAENGVFDIRVTASATGGGNTRTATRNVKITILDANDPPVVATNTGKSVDEAGSIGILAADLRTTDVDTPSSAIVYTLTGTTNGTLRLDGSALQTGGSANRTFTQADISAGRLSFLHDGSETTTAGFTFDVTDGASTVSGQTFALTVIPDGVTDRPATGTPVITHDGTPQTGEPLGVDVSGISDPDDSSPDFRYEWYDSTGRRVSATDPAAAFTPTTPGQYRVKLTVIDDVIVPGSTRSTVLESAPVTVERDNGAPDFPPVSGEAVAIRTGVAAVHQFHATDPNAGDLIGFAFPASGVVRSGDVTLDAGTGNILSANGYGSAPVGTVIGSLAFAGNTPGASPKRASLVFTPNADAFSHLAINAREAFTIRIEARDDDPGSPDTHQDLTFAVTRLTPVELRHSFALDTDNSDIITPANTTTTITLDEQAGGIVRTGLFRAWLPSDGRLATSSDGEFSATGEAAVWLDVDGNGMLDTSIDAPYGTAPGGVETFASGLWQYRVNPAERLGAGNDLIHVVDFSFMPAPTVRYAPMDASLIFIVERGDALVEEDGTHTLAASELSAGTAYTVTAAPTRGSLRKGTEVLGAGGTFTQADIDNGRVTYEHDGSETITDSFDYRTDGGTTGTFDFAVSPVNDRPVLGGDLAAVIGSGETYTVTAADLGATDGDHETGELTYIITAAPVHGSLRNLDPNQDSDFSDLDSLELGRFSTFTQADINAGYIVYEHDGSGMDDSFEFRLTDGTDAVTGAFTFQQPGFSQDGYAFSVEESDSAVVVGRVGASGSDTGSGPVAYSIAGNANGFTIDASGTIRRPSLDREGTDRYDLTVVARGDGWEGRATVKVVVVDADDHAPVYSDSGGNPFPGDASYTFTVKEADRGFVERKNTAGILQTVMVSDGDATIPNNLVSFSFVGDNHGFWVDDRGRIGRRDFDHETAGRYELTLRASSRGQTSDATVVVVVEDVNESPLFDHEDYSFNVRDDATGVVGTVAAIDPDTSDDANERKITYAIAGETHGFTIDRDSGEISRASFDRGAPGRYELTVVAASDLKSDTAKVVVTVSELGARSFTEGVAGSYQIPASAFTGSPASYSITSVSRNGAVVSTPGWMDIDDTGVVRIDSDTDDEHTGTWMVTVTASGGALGSAATTSFDAVIANVNEAPDLAVATSAVTLNEGDQRTLRMTDLRASDVDLGDQAGDLAITLVSMTGDGRLEYDYHIGTYLRLGRPTEFQSYGPLEVGATFTQADLDAGLVRFVAGGRDAALGLKVTDPGGLSSGTKTLRFDVTPDPVAGPRGLP